MRHEALEQIWFALGTGKRPMVLSIAEFHQLTGLSEKTIRRRVDAGDIRSSTEMDGRKILIPIAEAVRYCMV